MQYHFYSLWARALKKSEEYERNQFGYPKEVLNLIGSILPEDVKGEIREDAEKISLKDFCTALDFDKTI